MKTLRKAAWPLFALAAAFVLWITFVGSPEVVSSISAPVEYQSMPADLEIASELPQRVHLEIRGASTRLRGVTDSGAAVLVNLERIRQAGEHTISIGERNVDLPAGVSLVRAVPAQLRLRFERRLQVEVAVKARFATQPPHGYRIAATEVHPERLAIVGAENRVRQVVSVETDPIGLGAVVGKEQFQVHAYLADPLLRFVSLPEVKVSVALEKVPPGDSVPDAKTTVRN